MAAKVKAKGLKLYQLCTLGGPSASAGPFHNIRLEDVPRDFLNEQGSSEFTADLQALIRTMQIAARTGVEAVLAYSLSWSGEWRTNSAVSPPSGADPDWNAKAQTPTFAMRWATHGGIISEGELDRLVAIFRYLTEKAEHYGVDLVLAMRPFHFVSCARNFAAIADRVGSPRLKVQWSPADCLVSNERDYARGFGACSQTYGSILTVILHINDVPCCWSRAVEAVPPRGALQRRDNRSRSHGRYLMELRLVPPRRRRGRIRGAVADAGERAFRGVVSRRLHALSRLVAARGRAEPVGDARELSAAAWLVAGGSRGLARPPLAIASGACGQGETERETQRSLSPSVLVP
jgi:hypothetical protein